MSVNLLTAEQLDALRRYNTPTISNAIETFNIRQRHLGFLPHRIRCLLPDLGPIIGYAVTSQTRASFSPETAPDLIGDYLRYVAAQPGPKIAVGQDLDDPPGLGRPVRRGQRHDPQEARLRRPHHRRLPARPGRSPRPGLPTLRAQPLRQPRLRAAGRFRQAGPARGRRDPPRRPDPRRQARRLRHPAGCRAEARRGLRRGRANGEAPAGILPVRGIRPGGIPRSAYGETGQDPRVRCNPRKSETRNPERDRKREEGAIRIGLRVLDIFQGTRRGCVTTGSKRWLRRTASSGRISSSRLPSACQRPLRNSNRAVAWRGARRTVRRRGSNRNGRRSGRAAAASGGRGPRGPRRASGPLPSEPPRWDRSSPEPPGSALPATRAAGGTARGHDPRASPRRDGGAVAGGSAKRRRGRLAGCPPR